MAMFQPGDSDGEGAFSKIFGPGQVDQQIRQAIQTCWMMLPADRRNPRELESEIRRIVDRAFQSLREDEEHFGSEPKS